MIDYVEYKKKFTNDSFLSEEKAIEILSHCGVENPSQELIDITRREAQRKYEQRIQMIKHLAKE